MIAALVATAFVLAGEHVMLDGATPQFTARQMRMVAPEIRAGFARWAATPQAKRLLARFNPAEYEIDVVVDANEEGAGRAPQPSLATLAGWSDHGAVKRYEIILNPALRVPPGQIVFPTSQPATQADMMAAALAGEMLHVDFYSRGISLPHHPRPDFQDEWRVVARQLGYPDMKHEDDERTRGYAGSR